MAGKHRASEQLTKSLKRLLDQFNAGEQTAGDRVIEVVQDHVKKKIARMLRYEFDRLAERVSVDDVLQEVLTRLRRAILGRRPDNVKKLLGLASHRVKWVLIDLHRHHFGRRKDRRRKADATLASPSPSLSPQATAEQKHRAMLQYRSNEVLASLPEHAPEAAARREQASTEEVAFALAVLKGELLPDQLAVFQLRGIHGLPWDSVATHLGLSSKSVRNRMTESGEQVVAYQQANEEGIEDITIPEYVFRLCRPGDSRIVPIHLYLKAWAAFNSLNKELRRVAEEKGITEEQFAARFELREGMEIKNGPRLVRQLGQGRFAEVWLADASMRQVFGKNVPVGRKAEDRALVVLRAIPLHNGHWWAEQEAAAFAKHFVERTFLPVFGNAFSRYLPYLFVMSELGIADLGGLLREVLDKGHPGLPPQTVLPMLAQVALGIDHLNEKGYAHCNVKPSNMFIDDNELVQVADFGLMERIDSPRTLTCIPESTLLYDAPELLQGFVSAWVDQYSLALSYCELRTGTLPFAGDPQVRLAQAPDLSGLSEPEQSIVSRALLTEPKQRWPSCWHFMKALTDTLAIPLGVVTLEEVEPSVAKERVQKSTSPPTQTSNVRLNVRVPANADVWVQGMKRKQTGTLRQFISRGIPPGTSCSYEIRLQWTPRKGKTKNHTITQQIQSGQELTLDFMPLVAETGK